MINKQISILIRKRKMSGLEFDYGKWVCTKCDCTLSGMQLARLHYKETNHPIFPIRYSEGSHRSQ